MLYLYPREMKRRFLLLTSLICMTHFVPADAITIKKAATVATKQNDIKTTGTTLLPTVINLVSEIKNISNQQKSLTSECIPSSQEIEFVNRIFKEWIKTGAATKSDVEGALGNIQKCQTATGGYQTSVQIAAATEQDSIICYDYFDDSGDKNMVWHEYPRAQKAYYCTDDPSNPSCPEKNREYVTNMYDLFNLVDFSEQDYTIDEAKMAGTLMSKIEKCSYSKLNARKRAMWADFLVDTISGVGKNTNTSQIMQMVQTSANSGAGGALKTLGGNLGQFLQ